MAVRFSQQFIDDLLARADIVTVIDSNITLRKAGHEYKACCPFHQEKTPSFTVSPTKQFYHCFGCGAHGTAISFLMDYKNLSFVESIEELAHSIGIALPKSFATPIEYKQSTDLYGVLTKAKQLFINQLRDNNLSTQAVKYLKKRGITGETAKVFGLGYAPQGWDRLQNTLRKEGLDHQLLETAGLVIRNEDGRLYDRFRHRIIFPIHDRRGRVVGFGGRVMDQGNPKYLNSPETPIFHKGQELYGLFESRQAVRKIERMIVVEGYMDVLSLAQHGVLNCVATLGTALTDHHLNALYRVTSDVVFCFDGDQAGRQAAWRAAETALATIQKGRQCHFLFLPDGEDPDTIIQHQGKNTFEDTLTQATPLSQFLTQKLMSSVDMTHVDGRARFIELLSPLLNKVPSGAFRTLLVTDLSRQSGIPVEVIVQHAGAPKPAAFVTNTITKTRSTTARTPVRHALCLLLQKPELSQRVKQLPALHTLQLPGISLLTDILAFAQRNPNISTAGIIEHWREHPEGRHLAKLAATELLLPESGLEAEFMDTMRFLQNQHLEQRYSALEHKLALGVKLDETELVEYKQLVKVRHEADTQH